MGTLLHFKELYQHAFDECEPPFVVVLLKAYSVFCALMLTIALYAFIYRAVTGFNF